MLRFFGTVQDGKLSCEEEIRTTLSKLEGKKLQIILKLTRRNPSRNQHAYYRSTVLPVCVEIFRSFGNVVSEKEVHNHMKEHVGKLVKPIHDEYGEVLSYTVRSLGEVEKGEMTEFITQCIAFAAEYGRMIPSPEEFYG